MKLGIDATGNEVKDSLVGKAVRKGSDNELLRKASKSITGWQSWVTKL